MQHFVLDQRLAESSVLLKDFGDLELRLSSNALVTWFIVVPKVAVTEWFELDVKMQFQLNSLINRLSLFLKQELQVDKVNVATIGNVVAQMHIHVIGRKEDDFCWPDVVWGRQEFACYSAEGLEKLKIQLLTYLSLKR